MQQSRRPEPAEESGAAAALSLNAPSAEDRERYRSLFTYTPNAAFSFDLEGRYTAANPVNAELTGFTLEELGTMAFADVVHPDDLAEVSQAFADVVARQSRTVDCRLQRKDGDVVEVRVTGIPVIVDDEVIGVHGIAEDVTDAKRVLRELEEARQVAEAANHAQSLFLANVSHELRTPLAGTIAALEMLEDVEMPTVGRTLLDTAQRSGDRLMRLVDDLLDFISLAAGRLQLTHETFDVADLVRGVVAAVSPAAASRGLKVEVSLGDELPARLVGDPARLSRVLGILLDNAVKFTDEGVVRVGASVAEREDCRLLVCFEVSDTGIGVDPERQPTLFDPFVQEDGSMTRRHGGTGLGLAIFREIIALMQGTYTLESAPGQGTTITMTLAFEPA